MVYDEATGSVRPHVPRSRTTTYQPDAFSVGCIKYGGSITDAYGG